MDTTAQAKLQEFMDLGRPLFISLEAREISGQNLRGILTGYNWENETLTLQTTDCGKSGGGIRITEVNDVQVADNFTATAKSGAKLTIAPQPKV